MAGRKHVSRYFSTVPVPVPVPYRVETDEFSESDIWGQTISTETGPTNFSNPIRSGRTKSKQDRTSTGTQPSSLPVNIPDWSKILGEEYKNSVGARDWEVEDDEDCETGTWVPPHEMVCRNRVAMSFSVHEGIGRTLKGRDLSRVRNAIWEKTGFQD